MRLGFLLVTNVRIPLLSRPTQSVIDSGNEGFPVNRHETNALRRHGRLFAKGSVESPHVSSEPVVRWFSSGLRKLLGHRRFATAVVGALVVSADRLADFPFGARAEVGVEVVAR